MLITEFLQARLQRSEHALEQQLIQAQFWGTTNQLRLTLQNVFHEDGFLQNHAVVLICSDAINILTVRDQSSVLDVQECEDVATLPSVWITRMGHSVH